jgi:hypothetical protein
MNFFDLLFNFKSYCAIGVLRALLCWTLVTIILIRNMHKPLFFEKLKIRLI